MLRLSPRSERGASAVEFGLVLVPLLIIVFGLIQYGLYFWSAQSGSNTISAAARQISVGNCDTSGELKSFVDGRLGAAATGPATITRQYRDVDGSVLADQTPAKAKIGGTVRLDITFDTVNLNFPFVPFLDDPKVARSVIARVEDTTDQGCPA